MDWSKRVTLSPSDSSSSMTLWGCPAAVSPESVTNKTRLPNESALEPNWSMDLGPKTTSCPLLSPSAKNESLAIPTAEETFISSGKEALTQAAIPMERRL